MQKPMPHTLRPQPPTGPFAGPVADPFAAPINPRRDQRIWALAALAGVALTIIGIRFLVWPDAAARFFGLLGRPNGFQLHAAVALRDLWLGLLAIGLVWLGQWRAITLWLGLGALVCFGDAGIVYGAAGKPLGIAFHLASGLFLTTLAACAYRRAVRPDPTTDAPLA
jgi:Domain of unknown function (DUF4267)